MCCGARGSKRPYNQNFSIPLWSYLTEANPTILPANLQQQTLDVKRPADVVWGLSINGPYDFKPYLSFAQLLTSAEHQGKFKLHSLPPLLIPSPSILRVHFKCMVWKKDFLGALFEQSSEICLANLWLCRPVLTNVNNINKIKLLNHVYHCIVLI